MSGASGQCTCSIAFAMVRLRSLIGISPLTRQCFFDRQKIPPGKPLLQGLAQEISGMQRRNRANLARTDVKREPAATRLQDTLFAVEQRLRRRRAETDQYVRIGELDLSQCERQANRGFLRRRGAI